MKKDIRITLPEAAATAFLLIYSVLCFFLKEAVPMLLHWYGYVIFAYAVATWRWKTGAKWFSAYTVFFLFFVLFNYGQPLMWALGIHKAQELGTYPLFSVTGYVPSSADLIRAQWYTCVGMLVFHLAALLLAKRKKREPLPKSALMTSVAASEHGERTYRAMRNVGALILAVMAPLALYFRYRELQIAREYGYKALYYGDLSTQSGYMQILLFLFFPALICFLIGCRYSAKARAVVYLIFGAYAMLGLLAGDRGSWLYGLVILVWLHTYYKKVKLRTYLLLFLAGICGLYLLSVVTAVRDTGLEFGFSNLLDAFRAEESPLVDACFEMGGSMGIITYFLKFGAEIYPYGNTYLTALLGSVSSRLLSLFGIPQIYLSNWFSQDYLGISWGTGFSMIGEAFVNGGYHGGILYMAAIGALIGKMLSASARLDEGTSPKMLFFSAAALNAVAGFSRGISYTVIKELVYGTLLVLLLIWFFGEKKQRTKHESAAASNTSVCDAAEK